jgi:large subunit ribosomal protein L29
MAVARLKMAEIRELTDVELRAKIAEYEKERAGLRFKSATEVLGNPMDLRTARRTVAQLKTVLAERAAKTRKAKAT